MTALGCTWLRTDAAERQRHVRAYLVAQHEPVTVRAVAEALSLPIRAARRHLVALEERRQAMRIDDARLWVAT
jgi:predicted ArsR family transcriptional regulator